MLPKWLKPLTELVILALFEVVDEICEVEAWLADVLDKTFEAVAEVTVDVDAVLAIFEVDVWVWFWVLEATCA